jgi:mRNA interferase MazF
LKRGDVVIAAERGRLTGKPRPWLIIQSDAFNPTHSSLTVALVTSRQTGYALFRVPLEAGKASGLDTASEVQCDKLATISRASVMRVAGTVDQATIDLVDAALRRWLEL